MLRAHAAVLPPDEVYVAWKEEIDAIERLVNQLLDSARLDVVTLEKVPVVELNEVARMVAAQLAPIAVNAGKSIEVLPSNEPDDHQRLHRSARGRITQPCRKRHKAYGPWNRRFYRNFAARDPAG